MSERFTAWQKEDFSEDEHNALRRLKEQVTPRQEYAEGKLKLNFEYKFSSGEVLKAEEDKEGIAYIKILKDGQPPLDFSDYLPEGFEFATPSYKSTVSNSNKGQWSVDYENKKVSVGDIRGLKEIFSLLHEMGHTEQKGVSQIEMRSKIHDSSVARADKLKLIENISESERDASARAIHIARNIYEKYHIDLLEGFQNLADFQDFVHSALLMHRFSMELLLSITAKQEEGQDAAKEEREFLTKLFDKRKLQRLSKNENKN